MAQAVDVNTLKPWKPPAWPSRCRRTKPVALQPVPALAGLSWPGARRIRRAHHGAAAPAGLQSPPADPAEKNSDRGLRTAPALAPVAAAPAAVPWRPRPPSGPSARTPGLWPRPGTSSHPEPTVPWPRAPFSPLRHPPACRPCRPKTRSAPARPDAGTMEAGPVAEFNPRLGAASGGFDDDIYRPAFAGSPRSRQRENAKAAGSS